MNYIDFKNELFAKAKAFGFTDWEVYYSVDTSFMVRIFKSEISEYQNTDSAGLSFRGTYKGRVGYAYTEKMDSEIIDSLVKNAADNAGVIEEEEIEKLYPGDPAYPEAKAFNPDLSKVTVAEKIAMAMALEKSAFAQDARVKSVDYCQLGTSQTEVKIANSYGLDVSDISNLAYAYVSVRVEENDVTKVGYEVWHDNDFKKLSIETVAKAAVKRAVSALGAKSVESGGYPVILDNRIACSFISAFASVFYAENAQKGFSMLNNKQGEMIAAPILNLRDDGVYEGGFGNVSFDSEGVATKQKAVIENGVLKTLLYNTKSAAKDGRASTGNGFKASFQASVATACTNFYIVPSDMPPEKMMADIKRGVLVTDMAGMHAGINAVSGDFSVSSTGFLIEDGKISKPVEQITVAGNFYTLLKDIQCVGNDLHFNMPGSNGTFGMPSILIRELPVSGL